MRYLRKRVSTTDSACALSITSKYYNGRSVGHLHNF